MALREVVPGVLTWPWFSERFGYDFNGHLILDGGGNLAIDPVEMDAAAESELVARGVARILLTNRNHFRAAAKLRASTGARVAAHTADAAFVRAQGVTVDDPLDHGQRVGPLRVCDASGKSPGEVALHWPERRILIVGDACVGAAPGLLGLLPEKVIDDLPALRVSLARLSRELDFDTLLAGDGHSILGAPGSGAGRAALARLVASFG